MVTLTLDLTPEEAVKVLEFVSSLQSNSKVPTSPKATSPDSLPFKPFKDSEEASKESVVVTVPKSIKGIKMPGLGRTQAQIDDFTNNEQEKFNAKTEEQLRKEERATERAEKKALKEAEEAKKLAAKQKAQDEINAIKEAELTAPTTEMLIKKPWEL